MKLISLIIQILSVGIPLLIKNKELIIQNASKNKLANKVSKGLPFLVEHGETLVDSLKPLRKK